MSSKLPRAPELGWERSGRDRIERSGNSNVQDEKGKATGADEVRLEMMEMAGELGVKWTGLLLNVYAGGKDTEGVGDGPDNAGVEEQRGVYMTQESRPTVTSLLSQVLKLLERVLDPRIWRIL